MGVVKVTYTRTCGFITHWTTLALLHALIVWLKVDEHKHNMEQEITEA